MTISLNVSSAHGNFPCPSNPSSGTGWFRQALARPPRWTGGVVWGSLLTAAAVHAETLTVLNTEAGTTPEGLGYNLGHFMPGSNAAVWFRYSGVDAARVSERNLLFAGRVIGGTGNGERGGLVNSTDE